MRPFTSALLALLLAGLCVAQATVRLGDTLPPHPWQTYSGDEMIVLYSHDCGDLSGLWPALLRVGLPLHAINAEDIAAPAPASVNVWRGPEATQFSRRLRVRVYPTAILVRGGHIWQVWEGDEVGKVSAEVGAGSRQ